MTYVYNIDTGEKWGFDAKTPYEACSKLLYTLNLNKKDKYAKINKTNSGNFLYIEYFGQVWCINNKERRII